MDSKGSGNFFTGLLVGTVIGIAVGLIFAPQSGAETRQMLKQKASVAKEKAAKVKERVQKASTDIKGKLESQLE
jgi:gas vesicle protein